MAGLSSHRHNALSSSIKNTQIIGKRYKESINQIKEIQTNHKIIIIKWDYLYGFLTFPITKLQLNSLCSYYGWQLFGIDYLDPSAAFVHFKAKPLVIPFTINKSKAPVSTRAVILVLATMMSVIISLFLLPNLLVLIEFKIMEPSLRVSLSNSPSSSLAMAENLLFFGQSFILCGPSHKKHANGSLFLSPSLADFHLASGFQFPLFYCLSLSLPLLPLVFVESDFLNSTNDSPLL